MLKEKTLTVRGISFVLRELIQGDIVRIDLDSKRWAPRGTLYTDETSYNLKYVTASIKSWDYKEGDNILPINEDSVKKLPNAIFRELLEAATELNMTDKEADFLKSLSQQAEQTKQSEPKPTPK